MLNRARVGWSVERTSLAAYVFSLFGIVVLAAVVYAVTQRWLAAPNRVASTEEYAARLAEVQALALSREDMDVIKGTLAAMKAAETERAAQQRMERDGTIRGVWGVILLMVGLGVAVLTLGYLHVRRELRLRREAEDRVQHLSLHDSMTGLPNRRLLADRMSRGIVATQRYGHKIAMLFLDLDGFKKINDTHGHDIGDELLKEVASRLSATARQEDTVARLGGDEFVILLGRINSTDDAVTVAEKVIRLLSEPYRLKGVPLRVTTSIGISVCPEHGTASTALLTRADEALYRAKTAGKNRLQVFEPEEGELAVSTEKAPLALAGT